jgi:LytS/YehU family sensor histidine kinase
MVNTMLYLFLAIIILLIGCSIYLFRKLQKIQSQERESTFKFQALESKIDVLKLETLESRLNPHLFKNILNSIQSHAYQTYFALDKLANVLDYILYESRKKFVTPKEEIEFALNLIEINKIKVSPLFEFKLKTKIDDTCPTFQQEVLAPLISIDLIENAFKHADLQSPEAYITIVIEFKDNCFSMTVSNKISEKPALKKDNSGIGSETMDERLKILYKDRYSLNRFIEGDTYFAQLKIFLLNDQIEMPSSGR